ncbi:MAG: alpha/beta hydrolase [Pseudomonadota bacterium]
MTLRHFATILCLTLGLNSWATQPGALLLVPDVVDFGSGHSMDAERGYFYVSENRTKPDSNTITIAVLRFASTAKTPGDPIFVLAGGPGSSYNATLKNPRPNSYKFFLYQLINDLRSTGDVVIPDQRGAGLSLPYMNVPPMPEQLPLDEALTEQGMQHAAAEQALRIRSYWTARGHDVDGYHALQLADDLNELREALGYKKISIYGGSFGSQSTFTLIRRHPKIVTRILVWGIEDIDHTYDMPSGILNSYKAILADAEQDADLADHIPAGGILTAVRTVIKRLQQRPEQVELADPESGLTRTVTVGPEEFKMLWAERVRRRGNSSWPGSLLPVFKGDFSAIAARVAAYKDDQAAGNPTFPAAMFYAMDCGLAPSATRRSALANDPAIAVLGEINSAYYGACEAWQAPDVTTAFKAPLVTDLPALFIHGTWDLSTPLMNATAAIAGYRNGHLVVVERGTHGVMSELYAERPDFVRPLLREFFSAIPMENVPSRISLPNLDFAAPPATE